MTQTEMFALIDSWDITLLEKDYLKHRSVRPAPGNRRKRLKIYGLKHLKRALDAIAGRVKLDSLPKLSRRMHDEAARGMKTLLDGVQNKDPDILIFLADYILPNPPGGTVPYLQGRRSNPPTGYDEFLERCAKRYQTEPTPQEIRDRIWAIVLDRLEGWKQYLLAKKDSNREDVDAKVTALVTLFGNEIDYTVEAVNRFCKESEDIELTAAWTQFQYWCLNLGGGLPLPNEPVTAPEEDTFVPDPVAPAPKDIIVPDPIAPAPKDPDPFGIGGVFDAMNAPFVPADPKPPEFDEAGEEIIPPPKGQPLYEASTLLDGSFGLTNEEPEEAVEEEAPEPTTTLSIQLTPTVPEPTNGRLATIRKMRETLAHLSAAQTQIAEGQKEIGNALASFSELLETMLNE